MSTMPERHGYEIESRFTQVFIEGSYIEIACMGTLDHKQLTGYSLPRGLFISEGDCRHEFRNRLMKENDICHVIGAHLVDRGD